MPELPLVKLDVPQTNFWFLNTGVRQLVSNVFWKKYGRCVVLTAELDAVAVVEDGGRLRLLEFPYQRFEMWQIHNKPLPSECHCATFYDMEVGGEWSQRDLDNQHHPMCIYQRTAGAVFKHFADRGMGGITRPDIWTKVASEMTGTNIITSVRP